MAIVIKDKVEVPMEEKYYIDNTLRVKLFKNLMDNYKVYFPGYKREFAFLNYNSKNPIDYMVIFSTIIDGTKMICWDLPFLYTNRTIPAYRYVVKHDLYEDFFKDCYMHMCKMREDRFHEFLRDVCKMSLKKGEPRYWRSPEVSDELVTNMMEIAFQYTPR